MFKGKVAVVTGAGQGLGQGIAAALFHQGASVLLADLNGEMVARVAAELMSGAGSALEGRRAIAKHLDVSRQADMVDLFEAVASQFGRVDIMVNNAGIISKAPALELTEAQFQSVLDVNLKGVLFGCQEAAKLMMNQGGGSIINIASIAAHSSSPGSAAYSVSKSAVLALTRIMAVEWGQYGIRVNSVSPTGVATAMGLKLIEANPEAFARRARRVPIAREATVEDVVNAVLFFAADGSAYVTGRDILVDGGLMLQNPGFVT